MRVIKYRPERTVERFHRSKAYCRMLRGPVGTGKSVACVMELWRQAFQQEPDAAGVRYTRFLIVRNTYGELKSTTIKTFQRWIPQEICPLVMDAPIRGTMKVPHPDGKTQVNAEFLFLALDRDDHISKLLSLEVSSAWINEAREISWPIFIAVRQRCARFPEKGTAHLTRSGVIADTNPPDSDHWWAKLDMTGQFDEADTPVTSEDFEFFAQPPALLRRRDGAFLPNPEAENIRNHQLGYDYWLKQIPGAGQDYINVYILGQYGSVQEGRPVYPEFSDSIHVSNVELDLIPNLPVLIGFDFGLTPAAIIGQVSPRGQLRVIDEFPSKGMGIQQFCRDVLVPQLATKYPGVHIPSMIAACDPAGNTPVETDQKTCMSELMNFGFNVEPASTNYFLPRREAVASYLTTMSDGQPNFLLSPRCKILRRGFMGKYHLRRMQVPGKTIYRDVPDKDEYSHPHDGLQYLALRARQGVDVAHGSVGSSVVPDPHRVTKGMV